MLQSLLDKQQDYQSMKKVTNGYRYRRLCGIAQKCRSCDIAQKCRFMWHSSEMSFMWHSPEIIGLTNEIQSTFFDLFAYQETLQ